MLINLFVASRVLQFSSRAAFDMAVRLNARKGRLYRLDKAMLLHSLSYDHRWYSHAILELFCWWWIIFLIIQVDRTLWDQCTTYHGKVVSISFVLVSSFHCIACYCANGTFWSIIIICIIRTPNYSEYWEDMKKSLRRHGVLTMVLEIGCLESSSFDSPTCKGYSVFPTMHHHEERNDIPWGIEEWMHDSWNECTWWLDFVRVSFFFSKPICLLSSGVITRNSPSCHSWRHRAFPLWLQFWCFQHASVQ